MRVQVDLKRHRTLAGHGDRKAPRAEPLVPYPDLASSQAPLLGAATIVFGGVGVVVMAAGAMVSVSGSAMPIIHRHMLNSTSA